MNNDVALPYRWSLGPVWTRFFDGLKEETIYGTKCLKCNRVLVPARPFCPACYAEMEEWVEIGGQGTVQSWTVVNNSYYGQVKEPPYVMALIRLDGTDCALCHFIGGIDVSSIEKVRERIQVGTRVKVKWNAEKKASIYDIAYFEPAG
jgi:hypothetical protein